MSVYRTSPDTITTLEPLPLPKYSFGKCKACGSAIQSHTAHTFFATYCTGGSWWPWGCKDKRPHMHMRHSLCGAHWVTAPDDESATWIAS